MNWGGFPVAFRFPVQDCSLETKKRCWDYVLPALTYADLTNTSLWEAESAETFDADQLVYIAIVAPTSITPSRKNSLLWRRDGRLMSALTLYLPMVQENYLELNTKYVKLATVTPEREIIPEDIGRGLFPERIERREKAPFRLRALILPKGELPFSERIALCRQAMEELYEVDERRYLHMLPLSPGQDGAVYTAAAFWHGRFFSETIPDKAGEKHRCFFGALPGRKLLIDGFSVPDIAAPLREEYGLGRAIRVAKDRGFTAIRLCARGLDHPPCEATDMEDMDELYGLSRQLPLYDQVILAEYGRDGRIEYETIDMDRRDKGCVSSILSRRNGTAGS